MSKIKQKLSNLISEMKAWFHKKFVAPIFLSLQGFVSYLKNAPILPVIAGGLIVAFLVTGLMLNGSVQKFSSKLVQNVTAVTHKSLEKSGDQRLPKKEIALFYQRNRVGQPLRF